jgi:HPt (histidine-containing phosphotransfer) domain-containing protein
MYKDNIDTQKGITLMAGKKEIYIKIVNTFIKNVDAKSEDLRRFFADNDFARLTIEFHGLKSSSASVGSTLLPAFAMELEMAGKEGNNELIKEKFDAFIEQYKDTCGALAEAAEGLSS